MFRIKTLRYYDRTPFISMTPAFPFWRIPSEWITAKADQNNISVKIVRSTHNLFKGL